MTAQKREENVQDVPISITALSGDTLSQIGIQESEQLGEFLPGLEISTSSGEGSQLILFLRGAGLNDFNTNNSGPVAIYSDEVYVSSPALTAFQFFDTERVEVLKGPQGTLYGRNTTGGAVKFITAKPTDYFTAKASASYAEFDTTRFEAAVSGPIIDSIRARVAISKSDSDGYVTNLLDGSKENGVDTFSWRGTIDADVAESFTLRANIHGNEVSSSAFKFNHLGSLPGGVDALGYRGPDDPFEGSYNRGGNVDLSSIGGYLEANLELGAVTITSVTAYDEVDRSLPEETDSSPLDLLFVNYDVESETFTQELRISGEGDNFQWLLGGFYLTEDLRQNQTIDLFRELRVLTGGAPDPTGAVAGAPVLFARSLNSQDLETFAIFGQASYEILPDLTLTGGLRYTNEKKTFSALGQLEDPAFFPQPVPVYQATDLENKDDAISWRVALDYQATPDVLLYGSVAKGFKSGGFNGGFLSLDPVESAIQLQPYEPEFLTAYEVGIKSDWLDGALRVNAALFFNDFSDLQVFTLVNTNALPLQVLDNAGGAEVFGFELDTTIFPTDGLLFNISAAYLDSELSQLTNAVGTSFDGNRIANTPEFSVSALARYDFDITDTIGAFVQGSIAMKSDIFFSTENDPIVSQDGYALVNARAGVSFAEGKYKLSVFGTNLTDKAYLTNVTDLTDFGFYSRYFGQPRQIGVELAVEY
ncbi:TonB-dependent receptor [Parasphingorhabdus litoris]|uniref:TonB-dependent receptor n=1 Tax=Parasphingorhabdus litoris TaxID=394733 RepID=UPI001E5D6E78|nr:TonB-dependent receptor [Parasphingorhabdus litoris]